MLKLLSRNSALFLIISICFVEIFFPLLIQKGILPSEFRWIAHGLNILGIILYFQKTIVNKIPLFYFLWIATISIVYILVAIFNASDVFTILWGWWGFFRYPILGILVLGDESLSFRKVEKLKSGLGLLMLLEVGIQLYQYVSGTLDWDNIGGTFGIHGTGKLLILLCVGLSMYMSDWIVRNKYIPLIYFISIGIISSGLGEMKLYFVVLLMFSCLSLYLFYKRNKIKVSLIIGLVVVLSATILFPSVVDLLSYSKNSFSKPFMEQISDFSFINNYLTFVSGSPVGYDVGRNFIVQYIWKQNLYSNALLFGLGFGARAYSKSIGLVGSQLLTGDIGIQTGTSLAIILGEQGIVGIILIIIFIMYTLFCSSRVIKHYRYPHIQIIAYSVLIFTVFWPLWLWYNTAWTLPGSMPLYWLLWGATMHFYSQLKIKRGRKAYA